MKRVLAAAVLVAALSFIPASLAQQPGGSGWSADARQWRGNNYTRYVYGCPPGGGPQTVWGSGVYTDDSSVCTAAVHAGVIGFTRGGTVTIEIRPGQSSYTASTRNSVTTRDYGAWGGSFVVIGGRTTVCGPSHACIGGGGWTADARHLRSRIGERFTFTCPPGGPARTVWGTGLYTDDSSACTAGVHAGKISLARGGTVLVEMRPGQPSYSGSTRNGITSRSYGTWPGSFFVVGAESGGVGGAGWSADARHLRGLIGQHFAFTCPAGGPPTRIWGSGVYTDDSSVCTAGVHAGRITVARGGTVSIEVRGGQAGYVASTRNGITSRPWGSWPGSFVVL